MARIDYEVLTLLKKEHQKTVGRELRVKIVKSKFFMFEKILGLRFLVNVGEAIKVPKKIRQKLPAGMEGMAGMKI